MITFLLHLDDRLFLLINGLHAPGTDVFFGILTFLGSGWVVAPALLIIAFVKTPRGKLLRLVLFGALSMSACGLLNTEVKHAVKRPRPLLHFIASAPGSGAPVIDKRVHVVGDSLRYNSFPSGHCATAFGAATLLVCVYGRIFWFAYPVAVGVAYSRIYLGAHFPSDTVTGALEGILLIVGAWFLPGTRLMSLKRREASQTIDKKESADGVNE